MLKIQHATLARGAKVLIEDIDFTLFAKQTVGLVGANGCGKSSLLAAIMGLVDVQAGEIDMSPSLRIAHLAQEVPGLDMTASEYIISGNEQLLKIFQALSQAEKEEDYETVMDCHNQLAECDGYSAEAKAAKILVGLGFSQDEINQPVKSFSGGWRMRLNLGKCLFADSDLLLLDEPTNHLDMEAIIWLENFLKQYTGAIILVSHDRDFLDNIVTHIAHVENGGFKSYTGSYSDFERLRAEHIAAQNAQYRKQQAHIGHMMKYVDRFRYKASKAKQAQSRLKAIEKMELIKPIFEAMPFKFEFMPPKHMPNPMITLDKVSLGYDNHEVLSWIKLSIMAGQRIGLLGINGAGKSTFIKGLCGELQAMNGKITRAAGLQIGYFAQHQVDKLTADDIPLTLLRRLPGDKSEREMINYLASFAFSRDQSLSPVQNFSGGEKARLALALIIWQRPNLLLLDEPTNHLDMEMRQALSFALQGYEGSLILVSHDRHLARSLVDELLIIDNGEVSFYTGNIEDYQQRFLFKQ